MADDEGGGGGALTTFDDRALEEPLAKVSRHQGAHGDTAGGRSSDGHVVAIPSKCADIFLNPTQGGEHVQEPVIAGRRSVRRLRIQTWEA